MSASTSSGGWSRSNTIQKYTIQNKKNLESPGDEFRDSLRAIAADPARTRDYLMRVSMIASLARAEELG